MPKQITKEIVKLRKAKGLTQQQIADRLGLTVNREAADKVR